MEYTLLHGNTKLQALIHKLAEWFQSQNVQLEILYGPFFFSHCQGSTFQKLCQGPNTFHIYLVSGRISLIDFGLSDFSNNEKRKKNDFENLDHILGVHGSSEKIDSQESQEIFPDEKHGKHESDKNSSYEEVFDEISTKSFDTSTTKDDTITKK